MTKAPSARRLTLFMCVAQILTLLAMLVYAAQLPRLREAWSLTNTEAGWIASALFVGYMIAVPVLTSLTDRVDPKRIYLLGVLLVAAGSAGFGAFADDFASALAFQAVTGTGIAGTYMPGLKGLLDQIDPAQHSRANAFYAGGFGLGIALSFPFSDGIAAWLGWPYAFFSAAIAALAAGLLVQAVLPRAAPAAPLQRRRRLLDFRPVLRNRAVMAYSIGYGLHCWELFGLRTWVVALLVYAESLHGAAPTLLGPAIIAAVMTFLGVPVNIVGNELAMRFNRRRVISLVMCGSALACVSIGLTPALSYWAVAFFCLLHGCVVALDSVALTAGALGHAEPGYRGATMALHSMIGFGGGTLGPLAFGWVLDMAGGETPMGWWLAFAHMGVLALAGAILMALLKPPSIAGDRQ
ncbi:MAG: MFS transporter [Methyloligellaceae bacterium]